MAEGRLEVHHAGHQDQCHQDGAVEQGRRVGQVVQDDVVKFFYEVINYYPEFENAFNRDSEEILRKIRSPKR